MADGDLYTVDLSPGTAGSGGVPKTVFPNGSIGGSDVGANEEDDQRVRDLMQQSLNSSSVIEMLNNLLIINNSNIGGIIGGWVRNDFVNMQSFDEGLAAGGSFPGVNHAVACDGSPIVIQFSAYVDFLSHDASSVVAGNIELVANIYVDDILLGYGVVDYPAIVGTIPVFSAQITVSLYLTGLSAASHNFRVEYTWGWAAHPAVPNTVSTTHRLEMLHVLSDRGSNIAVIP